MAEGFPIFVRYDGEWIDSINRYVGGKMEAFYVQHDMSYEGFLQFIYKELAWDPLKKSIILHYDSRVEETGPIHIEDGRKLRFFLQCVKKKVSDYPLCVSTKDKPMSELITESSEGSNDVSPPLNVLLTQPPQPASLGRAGGRIRKRKSLSNSEDRVKRRCKRCNKKGHYRKTCKNSFQVDHVCDEDGQSADVDEA